MAIPRVRMFAGPNGSGKSDLLLRLQDSDLPLGPVVNADILLDKFRRSGFIDLKEYELSGIVPKDWYSSLKGIDELKSRIEKAESIPDIEIREDMLICEEKNLNAYTAALITDFIRYMMLDQKISFSFETVMSHPGKIAFMRLAGQKGYKTYLYFIATDHYNININRVKNRVQKGGHDVPEEKIKTRYERSLDLLHDALETVDRAYIMDNSKRRSVVVFEKRNDGKGYIRVKNYPRWFEKYVIEKLSFE